MSEDETLTITLNMDASAFLAGMKRLRDECLKFGEAMTRANRSRRLPHGGIADRRVRSLMLRRDRRAVRRAKRSAVSGD